MHARDRVHSLLDDHEPSGPDEAEDVERVRSFVEEAQRPMDRDDERGHVVASGLVASPSLDRVVLLHHRQLDQWLQPGGHAEPGETRPSQVALREAREETQLDGIAFHEASEGLLDVDVHEIPATDAMPAHLHHDLRFLLEADADSEPEAPADEAHEVRWFGVEEARAELDLDEGLDRMLEKVAALAPRADGRA